MDSQVQQFLTVRFVDLWLDVPPGPLVIAVSESWETITASQTEPEKEKEVTSAPKDGFVSVLSQSAKRRMRATTRASKVATYDQHVKVHKAAFLVLQSHFMFRWGSMKRLLRSGLFLQKEQLQ
jgi:hypothetical protein